MYVSGRMGTGGWGVARHTSTSSIYIVYKPIYSLQTHASRHEPLAARGDSRVFVNNDYYNSNGSSRSQESVSLSFNSETLITAFQNEPILWNLDMKGTEEAQYSDQYSDRCSK